MNFTALYAAIVLTAAYELDWLQGDCRTKEQIIESSRQQGYVD